MRRYCGVGHCVGVANGTDALFIALRTLGVGPGDEVITAANSFVATSEAIKMAGAQVVFVDIDPATYNIDVERIEEKITREDEGHHPGAPVRAAGRHGRRFARWRRSTACASSATRRRRTARMYRGQPIAQLADITCFSFYPGKNLGAYGDAGALVTDNAEWATDGPDVRQPRPDEEVRPRLRGRQQPAGRPPGGDPERQASPPRALDREPAAERLPVQRCARQDQAS